MMMEMYHVIFNEGINRNNQKCIQKPLMLRLLSVQKRCITTNIQINTTNTSKVKDTYMQE